MRLAAAPLVLMTEDFDDPQVGTRRSTVEQRFDLEAVTVPGTAPQRGCLALGTWCTQPDETEVIERVLPERGVAVAEIAPRLAIREVREEPKGAIADPPRRPRPVTTPSLTSSTIASKSSAPSAL
jgi:hypothetical protein